MQNKNKNSTILRKALGEVYKELREANTNKTRSKIEDEYDLSKSTISRVEYAQFDCKFITIWKMAEAIGLKLSDVVLAIEEKLPEDFRLIDD